MSDRRELQGEIPGLLPGLGKNSVNLLMKSLQSSVNLLMKSLQSSVNLLMKSLQSSVNLLMKSLQSSVNLLMKSLQSSVNLLMKSLQSSVNLLMKSLQSSVNLLMKSLQSSVNKFSPLPALPCTHTHTLVFSSLKTHLTKEEKRSFVPITLSPYYVDAQGFCLYLKFKQKILKVL